jgi:leucyl/phenylalanyl-tRNA--protein transferase
MWLTTFTARPSPRPAPAAWLRWTPKNTSTPWASKLTRLCLLDPDRLEFPPVVQALDDPPGLLALGGDLRPERLISAYRSGVFPWYNPGDPILWWSPDPRCVIDPATFTPSRSLAKTLRQGRYRLTVDQCFSEVMEACAGYRPYADGTWINTPMIQQYSELHRRGIAHSIEAWDQGDRLVGGLYGLNIGRLFFGESMFSRATDASKAAFAHLMNLARDWGFPIVDCQLENPHLMSLGARLIPRTEFVQILLANRDLPAPDWGGLPAL